MPGLRLIFLGLSVFLISKFSIQAQIHFEPLELGKSWNSGSSLASVDINGDLLPDLVSIHQGVELWIGLNTGDLRFLWQKLDEIDGIVWTINIADIDNNGYNDIIVAGEQFGILLFSQNLNGFTKSVIDATPFFSQASTLYDLDKNGYLDLTICDELAKTRLYLNLFPAPFKRDTTLINFKIKEKDSEAGNYGCIWSDIDDDDDPDLYISRCRPDVKDSTDRRRRNLFYHNDKGTFVEEADLRNIGCLDQSWASDIADLDGDGLLDLVVLNHYSPSIIYRQTPDHHFINATKTSGFNYQGIGIQISLQDFDNDMDIDILIAGDKTELWLNDGTMNFSVSKGSFLNNIISTFSIADFNQDGALDLNASFADLINSPNIIRDRILLGIKNKNNFIGFTLQGEQSNRNGIGCKIKLFVNGIKQSRALRCGESFGIQNTHQVHFGLGMNNVVDSIIVEWPNGTINKYYQLNPNQYYVIHESGCLNNNIPLYPSGHQILCDTASIKLAVHSNLKNIEWNTGEQSDTIRVNKPGIYFYKAIDQKSCPIISKSIYLEYNPIEHPKLNVSDHVILCHDDQLELSVPGYTDILWQDMIQTPVRSIIKTGSYFAIVKGECASYITDTLIVQKVNEVPAPYVRDTSISTKKIIQLESNLEHTKWFSNFSDTIPLYEGKKFQTPLIEKNTQYWIESYVKQIYPTFNAGLYEPEYQFIPYHAQTLNGGLYFKVIEDCTLDSVTLYTDREGIRRIVLKDDLGTSLDSIDVNLNEEKNRIALNFRLQKNQRNYFLTTSTQWNKQRFLNNTPWLFRSNINLFYPIQLNGICTIISSASGESEYHYFYDWKLTRDPKECTSDRVPVQIHLNTISTSEISTKFDDYLSFQNRFIYIKDAEDMEYFSIYDIRGVECIKVINPTLNRYSCEKLCSGIYFIQYRLKGDHHLKTERLLVE